jgi:hypothetical protein
MATKIPGAGTKTPEPQVQDAPPPAGVADLPNAVDIDPAKITEAVLTRQGWILPPEKAA